MEENPDTAGASYRKRAEELRTIAETMKDKSARETLLDIAADYERMAGTLERMDEVRREHKP